MNILYITLGNHQSKMDSAFSSIDEIRSSMHKPIEVEVFGPQIFLSIIGSRADVSLKLMDKHNKLIDSEDYQLGAK